MAESPNESEVVDAEDVAENQLDAQYHTSSFLRGRLLTTVHIPSIKLQLRDSLLRRSHQTVIRICNHLYYKAKSAGSI